MIHNKKIKALIQKFALNQCNDEEVDQLIKYFENAENPVDLPDLESLVDKLEPLEAMDQDSADRIFQRILAFKRAQETIVVNSISKRKSIIKYTAAIAIVTVLIAIPFFYHSQFKIKNKQNSSIAKETLDKNGEASEVITLQLQNGEIEIIEEDGTSKVLDNKGNIVGKQKGNQLSYNHNKTSDKLEYNTLKVPFGKNFELILSDGSKVHLNAGSSLRYPIQFVPGKERQVLLKGEAFFDVAKDHSNPFIINSGELNIRVLGTKFNVSAYEEDELTEVVLVEGSVGLYNESEEFHSESFLLTPGNKGSFDKHKNTIDSQEVITGLYTSWMNGELVFRNMTFENILKKMERHYNVSVVNNNPGINEEKFNASFRNAPIEKVMEYFRSIYQLDFTINGKEITIH
ncbi:FecR family protein [Arenibacter algicola]|uniref:Fec operon regulator FecR n=1 Tax=Arenibacter algicola TaxID=616991 RepID=A0A221V1E8_9FLAO|nr:FecR domain-containing protein [Arenibacter algicola]ASO07360.1 fec operon regulator FecR [Arenibacter algicola]|tara:strand:- start:60295 stop:61500 length:1206 start_codon:yes stop_codon:yes gene_type:complete